MKIESLIRRVISHLPQCSVYALFFFIPLQTVYVFMTPLIGEPLGVWQYGVIGLYGIDIIALMVILFTLLVRKKTAGTIRRRNERIPMMLILAGWITLVIWSLIALQWAPHQWSSVYGVFRLIEIGAVVWALMHISWSWIGGLISIVSMAALQGALAWQQFLFQRIDENKWLGLAYHSSYELGDSVVESVLRRFLRAYGMFAHPNMLGIYLAIALVLCVALLWYVRHKWQGYILVLAWASIASGLILTFSRAAWIAALAGSLCMAIMMAVLKKRIHAEHEHYRGFGAMIIASSVVIVGVAGYALWEPISTRLGVGGLQRLEVRSLAEREVSLKTGIQAGKQTFPWGTGFGQSTYAAYKNDIKEQRVHPSYLYQPTHAVPLLVVQELGVAGILVGLLFVVGMVWVIVCRIRRVSTAAEAVHVSVSVSLLLVLGIALLSDHFLWTTHAGGMMVVAIVALIFVQQQTRRRPPLLFSNTHIDSNFSLKE